MSPSFLNAYPVKDIDRLIEDRARSALVSREVIGMRAGEAEEWIRFHGFRSRVVQVDGRLLKFAVGHRIDRINLLVRGDRTFHAYRG